MVIGRRAHEKENVPFQDKSPFSKWLILLLIITSSTTIVIKIGKRLFRFEDERKELERQLDRYNNAEQYVLLATRSGWFKCCKCAVKNVFLLNGQVWKYGSTLKKYRYSKFFLSANNLEYIIEFEGDLTSCRKEEITKIRMYKFSSENVNRSLESRLLRPPGNCKNY
ncbi:MAG: hypothetical protein R2828_16575 [Saprospiraceae bacterium]